MAPSKARISIAAILGAFLVCALLLVGCGSSENNSSGSGSSASQSSSSSKGSSGVSAATGDYISEVSPDNPYGSGIHHAVLTVEGFDPIEIVLNADAAPVTVANFCDLANEGFYNGLTFYRFVADFCMQGGSSNNSAAAANDGLVPIVGEFQENGIKNSLASDFKKGTVAMARSTANSATSTFFITLATSPSVSQSLDDKYAAFGTIDSAGMAIVDKIVATYLPFVTDPSMGSIDDVADQAKIHSIEILD